jgi:hypothetical protein
MTRGAVADRHGCEVEPLTARKVSSAVRPSTTGTAMSARRLAISHARRTLALGGSDSVRGAPSSRVSRVKIANIDLSRGSAPSRALSILYRTLCWLTGKLTTVHCPGKPRRNSPVRGRVTGIEAAHQG